MAKATVLPCTPTSLIGLRLVDDDMALHLCSYTRDDVLERSCLFLSVGVLCSWVQISGVQTQCVEHIEAFSIFSLAKEVV
jgi:hypothetical protein